MEKLALPPPAVCIPVCDGIATVIAYGRLSHGKTLYDWSLRLQQEERYALARQVMLAHARNRTLWAPKPLSHNGLVVCPLETPLSEIDINTEGIVIRRGVHADGVVLHSVLDAFLMTPADCATVVLSYKDVHNHRKVIAMHASRESLIDMSRFKKGRTPREHEGVVLSALSHIPKNNLSTVRAWVGISVSPGPHFAHSREDTGNPHNENFVDYISKRYGGDCFAPDGEGGKHGWLDKRILVKRQLASAGVPEDAIECDNTCTYSEKDSTGEYRWYSHIRNTEEGMAPFRNLVMVIRNH